MVGNYILLLHLPQNNSLAIGKLGQFDFPAGWYTYVGSAFGAGGLKARIKRHLESSKTLHWHIDYLRQVAEVDEIWLSPGTVSHEEAWVDVVLSIPGASIPVDGFGASDSDKDSHLIYFDVRPSMEDFAVPLRWQFPEARVLRAFATKPAGDESS